jgi:hypothetical protein
VARSDAGTQFALVAIATPQEEVLESNFGELLELQLFFVSQYVLGRLEN